MNSPPLYYIPKHEKDPARFVWTALVIFAFVAIASCWLASEYVAWSFGWGRFAMPWDIFVWLVRFDRPQHGAFVTRVFERARLVLEVGALASLLLPVAIAYRRSRRRLGERNDLHGSAHWAVPDEVRKTGLLPDEKNRGGVLFGAWEDEHGRVHYLRDKGPEHLMVFAPTRSGKGVGVVVPTLLNWDESVLVNDIKGELWHWTSGFRSKVLGQRCLWFAPANKGSARFNPLAEIRITEESLIKDTQNISTMIVDPDGKGLNDHWAKTGFDLLVGAILFVLLDARIRHRTLEGVAALLSNGGEMAAEALKKVAVSKTSETDEPIDGAQAVMQIIRDTANEKLKENRFASPAHRTGWLVAAQASQAMLNKAPNEFSGVMSTTLSFLTLYRDPVIAENTAISDFRLEDLMGGGFGPDGSAPGPKVSLYIVSPPSDKDRINPLTRLLLNMVIRRLTEGMAFNEDGTSRSLYPHRLLLLIDEFPSLGKLDVFQEALAFIAGYGLKAVLIAQDLSQLMAAYTKDESIISNCRIRLAYAPNKVETADLLSQMAGQATVSHQQLQYSGNRLSILLQNVNTNEQIVQRPLLTADECMRLPSADELVFVSGHAPVYCQKIVYYTDPMLNARMKVGAAKSTGRAEDPLGPEPADDARTARMARA